MRIFVLVMLLFAITRPATAQFDVKLTWYRNTESDFDYYNVYRENQDGPAGWRKIGKTTETVFVDTVVGFEVTVHYALTAVDTSENESAFSTSVSLTTDRGVFWGGTGGTTGTIIIKPGIVEPEEPEVEEQSEEIAPLTNPQLFYWMMIGGVVAYALLYEFMGRKK